MKRLQALLLLTLLSAWTGLAAPQVQDLGEGLSYIQIRHVPADIPGKQNAPLAPPQAWVIDLRGAKTDQSQSRTLVAWLRFHSKASTPSLVLLNADTTEQLRDMIMDTQWPSMITLAPAPSGFRADILVDTNLEADRKAGDSIEDGKALRELITIKQAKARWDESILAKEKANGGTGLAPMPESVEKKPDEAAAEAFKPNDQVLARAVQIHRSLIALKALKPPVNR